jgi:NADPH:quinone reductase-like Zn-dependent oxidoreductase
VFAIRRAVAPGGRYSVVGGRARNLLSIATIGRLLSRNGRRIGVLMLRSNKDELRRVVDLVASGELRPSIERTYPLERLPDALGHLGAGRALGKLVIEVR